MGRTGRRSGHGGATGLAVRVAEEPCHVQSANDVLPKMPILCRTIEISNIEVVW